MITLYIDVNALHVFPPLLSLRSGKGILEEATPVRLHEEDRVDGSKFLLLGSLRQKMLEVGKATHPMLKLTEVGRCVDHGAVRKTDALKMCFEHLLTADLRRIRV
jgi:hypothetical protein